MAITSFVVWGSAAAYHARSLWELLYKNIWTSACS